MENKTFKKSDKIDTTYIRTHTPAAHITPKHFIPTRNVMLAFKLTKTPKP